MPRVSTSSGDRLSEAAAAALVDEEDERNYVLVVPDDNAVARRVRISQVVGKNAGVSNGSLVLVMEKGHPERKRVVVCSIVGKVKGAKVYCPAWMGFEEVEVKKFRQDFEDLCEVELTSEDAHLSEICGEELPKQMVNYLARSITGLFARCRDSGLASLIFIDEVDAVCPDREGRGNSSGTEAERRMVASLLTEMDGAGLMSQGSNPPLVVLGATNRPNAIDPAARRAGRFELEVSVGVPDESGRKDIIEVVLHRDFPPAVQERLRPSIDEIARKTHGFVGADLKALLSRACSLAMNEGSTAGVELRHVQEALKFIKPSALKELIVEVARTRWSDIGGYEDVKKKLIEAVVWPLTHSALFAEMGVAPPRGILLYGPPGCSKTMLARAVATETEMNFISIKGPELFSKWVGDSEAKVRDLFRKARQAAPTVVFIDEVDAIGQERATGGGGVADRVLAQLLTELDGVGGQAGAGVVLIAATNRPWAMDAALLRPGRIDRLVHVPLPDSDARGKIWRGALAKVPHAVSDDDIDDHFVSATEGYSGAEIVAVVKEACMVAVRREIENRSGSMELTRELIDEGLSRVRPRITPELAQSYVEYADEEMKGRG
ncbi:cell division cycle protein 48, putative [Perkinsus marinus ATCC 50983]|uniref:Cell division cycle protein 48, putative n=1 Tax=Perkinsus marinus (strain ATCC 50983 / TXsc) TaxID=423536 RepID=C5LCR1_PERM5|nr:cell division cycle protein 48, putative [Perkinsus marinus ATCC 50983]EER05744.1 cell division cycle protein 48, putative [Perkinsus marinus ATCC 50983]|eukprot:XP_002773928.1 cell division cycle protein 48, putative [Perkinsus marinus ATCC 50983]